MIPCHQEGLGSSQARTRATLTVNLEGVSRDFNSPRPAPGRKHLKSARLATFVRFAHVGYPPVISVIPSEVEGPCVSAPGCRDVSKSFSLIPHKDVGRILSSESFVRSETKLGEIDSGK